MTIDREAGRVYPDWSFADRLRKARITVGMTQEEFATAIEVREGTLAAWETDRAQPRSRDIVDIAKRIEVVTKIPATWVLDIDDSPPPRPPAAGPIGRAPSPPRRLRAITHSEPIGVQQDVSDDAMAYLRLAGETPITGEETGPLGRPRRSTGSGGSAGAVSDKPADEYLLVGLAA